jgi:hypothetical protein
VSAAPAERRAATPGAPTALWEIGGPPQTFVGPALCDGASPGPAGVRIIAICARALRGIRGRRARRGAARLAEESHQLVRCARALGYTRDEAREYLLENLPGVVAGVVALAFEAWWESPCVVEG